MRRQKRWPIVAATTVCAATAAYFLLPVLWLLVAATKTQGDLTATNGFLAGSHLTGNIGDLFTRDDGIFLRWVGNSVLYAGGGAAMGTLLAAMAGYGLAKYAFRGRDMLFAVVLGGVLVPTTALALPLFLLTAQVGQTNTYASVLIPSVVSPFGVYLARIFASAVPKELMEAARIDGAGEFQFFFTVAVRLMSPALVTLFLFQFVGIWNNFFLPQIMLQDQELYPLTYGLYYWQSQLSHDPRLQMLIITGALVSILPIIALFLSLQRFWRAGLALGAVK
ncbi:sugar ABC transporter permease [Longispora fulva]|uniref:Multiple sugar transport system permease protein n=1 Tax=Longispora fulva TaxID=619741 RepID=A0A8J7KFL9_9ACTN|nr:carbohydrate ABC transporter permease [Longispora fulva]MBG6136350.1 multiple sugar transport system permease protein [Longispora fulva]GIG63527.1 sugar ABC transporter permease [Longispora fulva]